VKKPKVQHIVATDDMARVWGTGKKVTPLCGKKYAPKHEGSWEIPICKKCAQMAGSAPLRPFRTDSLNAPGTWYEWRVTTTVPGYSSATYRVPPLAG
jgi:hypothetical protein